MTKLKPEIRKQQILDAALYVAERDGYGNILRNNIAMKANISPSLIHKYYGTMGQLRRSVMRQAISQKCLPIIAQGLVLKDKHAMKAPEELKRAALESLVG